MFYKILTCKLFKALTIQTKRDQIGKMQSVKLINNNVKNVIFSVNHSDFVGPPRDYKPMQLAKKHAVIFDYLQTDEALPYPPPVKDTSEAAVSKAYTEQNF